MNITTSLYIYVHVRKYISLNAQTLPINPKMPHVHAAIHTLNVNLSYKSLYVFVTVWMLYINSIFFGLGFVFDFVLLFFMEKPKQLTIDN